MARWPAGSAFLRLTTSPESAATVELGAVSGGLERSRDDYEEAGCHLARTYLLDVSLWQEPLHGCRLDRSLIVAISWEQRSVTQVQLIGMADFP